MRCINFPRAVTQHKLFRRQSAGRDRWTRKQPGKIPNFGKSFRGGRRCVCVCGGGYPKTYNIFLTKRGTPPLRTKYTIYFLPFPITIFQRVRKIHTVFFMIFLIFRKIKTKLDLGFPLQLPNMKYEIEQKWEMIIQHIQIYQI